MSESTQGKQLSWRDPDGFVVDFNGRILRAVARAKADLIRELLGEEWVVRLMASGQFPATKEIDRPGALLEYGDDYTWLEHASLPFPGYPHEITALQLYDSGVLTLKVALDALERGWVLKDASAWNILHSLGRPVFVDILSFERRTQASTWMAYGQFARHFLLPLLLYRKLGITPGEIFVTNRDGITPERAYQMLKGPGLLSPTCLELILLPKWLSRAGSQFIAEHKAEQPRAAGPMPGRDLVKGTLVRLEKLLTGLKPSQAAAETVWENYEEGRSHYSDQDLITKKNFVRESLGSSSTVLDLGCNAGEFSMLAAEGGREVVAADFDHGALSRFYGRIRGTEQTVMPVMLNISRPTPAIGWENRETKSFLDRAVGRFDAVLALGLLHHLLVSDRSTLTMIAQLLDRLAKRSLIVEWIEPTDPKFVQVAGFNGSLYSDLSAEKFEASLVLKFRLIRKLRLPCTTRVMYLWER